MERRVVVDVENLTVSYPDGRRALSDVSFNVFEGESVALLGTNGAGKSTLLLALVGVLEGKGKIIVNQLQLCERSLPDIRRSAQLVFQDPNDQLFMPVLRDDVAFGPLNFGMSKNEALDITVRSLESVGLSGFEARNPHNMSLGERKRAAIAAVLACSPEILLLDEPSAGFDPRGKRELAELLNSLSSTKIIATHDMDFARKTCNYAIVLSGGRIAACITMDDLLSDTGLLNSAGLI